jgi:GNAT superfamily N-acetyltransferase
MSVVVRTLCVEDYAPIIRVLNDWWGGRHMSDMLPKLFFEHFGATSLAAEVDGVLAGFLMGFLSPADPGQAYIHFVGVDPALRGLGVGRVLYERFFEIARKARCDVVRCVTSPVNVSSIAFHQRMGFVPLPGDAVNSGGTPFHSDYDGPGEHRVLLSMSL